MKKSLQQSDLLPSETDHSMKAKVMVGLDLSSFRVSFSRNNIIKKKHMRGCYKEMFRNTLFIYGGYGKVIKNRGGKTTLKCRKGC